MAVADAVRPVSVTHQHILTVLRTLLADGAVRPRDGVLRILEIGCGDGRLIAYLQAALGTACPGIAVELHGFDIGEQGYKDSAQIGAAARLLARRHPGIDWRRRLRILSDREAWGYPPGAFDIAVSNQVLEHVEVLPAFLANLREALAPEGVSVHVFPLGSCVIEAHCGTPFAHWIRDFDRRVAWIGWTSRLGIGRYRHDRAVLGHANVAEHARETATYIQCWTSYRRFRDIADACYQQGLAVSGGFTKDFFLAKLRAMARRPQPACYRRWPPGLEWLSFVLGRTLSSSTLLIRPLSYDIGRRIAAEKAAARLPDEAPERVAA
jgi:SAM-dependent methyltransferase